MYIDFGSGEAILARHEEETLRGLNARQLRQQARDRRQPSAQVHQLAARLRCELDYQRLVLAERLARFGVAKSVLRPPEAGTFSSGPCR
jgi:hypothetical protein